MRDELTGPYYLLTDDQLTAFALDVARRARRACSAAEFNGDERADDWTVDLASVAHKAVVEGTDSGTLTLVVLGGGATSALRRGAK